MAGIPKKLKAALLAATIAGGGVGGYQEMTRQSLIHLENIAYMPYRDIAGVLTVCVGHTGPDIEMRRYCPGRRDRHQCSRTGTGRCCNRFSGRYAVLCLADRKRWHCGGNRRDGSCNRCHQ